MGWGSGNLGGGSGGLNFKIVSYATESELLADTPKENTIGVITSIPITGYHFGTEEPSPAAAGMVWITTGTSSTIAFNALKKNAIQVYPISAKQHISGAWVDVAVKSYSNGKWVELVTDCILVPNSKYTWRCLNHNSVSVGSSGTVTFFAGTADDVHGFACIDEDIDMTDYNTMEIVYETTQGYKNARIGVMSVKKASIEVFSAYADISGGATYGKTKKTVNIEGVNGSHYVGVAEYNGTVTIHSIKLIK